MRSTRRAYPDTALATFKHIDDSGIATKNWRRMAEQRNETVTPKTATVQPVEVTVAVRSNQAVTDLETAHVVGGARARLA